MNDENVLICNIDAIEIMNTYKNEDNLIILDPPYFSGCNEMYNNKQSGAFVFYNYFFSDYEISNNNSKLLITVEHMWLNTLLSNKLNFINSELFTKKYQMTKKITKHIYLIKN